MLKVELRALEQEDLILDETGVAETLGIELTPEFSADPLEIHCQLSKNGDLILAHGWVKGKMFLSCDRCLGKFESVYKSYFETHYRRKPREDGSGGETEFPADQAETVYFEGEMLDIAEQVRQTVLLSAPMRSLCREDCRGLCGGCGADLNVDKCRCAGPSADSRWDLLRGWKPKP
jgi:uncharacterized protein